MCKRSGSNLRCDFINNRRCFGDNIYLDQLDCFGFNFATGRCDHYRVFPRVGNCELTSHWTMIDKWDLLTEDSTVSNNHPEINRSFDIQQWCRCISVQRDIIILLTFSWMIYYHGNVCMKNIYKISTKNWWQISKNLVNLIHVNKPFTTFQT